MVAAATAIRTHIHQTENEPIAPDQNLDVNIVESYNTLCAVRFT